MKRVISKTKFPDVQRRSAQPTSQPEPTRQPGAPDAGRLNSDSEFLNS